MKRRLLGFGLAVAMVLTLLPTAAFALDGTTVATIGTNEYTSLEAAIKAAGTDGVGTEVVLQSNLTDVTTIRIGNGKTVTVNLNGNSIGFARSARFFVQGGTLNLTGTGRVYEQTNYYAPVTISGLGKGGAETNVNVGSGVTLAGWSALFITPNSNGNYGIHIEVNGTLQSYRDSANDPGAAIYVNGQITDQNGAIEINLNGATLTGMETSCSGMYLAGYAVTNINDSTITGHESGGTGIEIRAGKLTVSNSTITGGSGEYTGTPNGNGSTSNNAALAVVQHTTKRPLDVSVENGSTLTGTMAFVQANAQNNGVDAIALVSLAIEDGTFDGQVYSQNKTGFISDGNFSNPVDKQYLDASLTAELYSASNPNTPYSYHPSVAAAQQAAQPGDVVTDLEHADTNERYQVTFDYWSGKTETLSSYKNSVLTLSAPNRGNYWYFQGWSGSDGKVYSAGETVDITSDITFTALWQYIPPVPSYLITLPDPDNGTVTADRTTARQGTEVTLTVTPDRGYEVGSVTVTDFFGNAVDITRNSDGTYSFVMPYSQVTVSITFAAEEPIVFTDVPEGAYYYNPVYWAVANGVTDGTSETEFSPGRTVTRGEMVTFLWRAAGSPEPTTTVNPFEDVAGSAYYYDAVLWAVEQGITDGTSETEFSPSRTLTRAEAVTFLWRAADRPTAAGSGFADVDEDAYYYTAVLWAVGNGVTDGTSDTTFDPALSCTRAQAVTFLYRAQS